MAVASYLADTSAYARLHHPLVRQRLSPLIRRGLVATCSVIDLELLFSSRGPTEYEDLLVERRGYELLDTEQVDWDRAGEVQRHLAATSQHRSVGLPDLVLAAVAERHRVTLLHYDGDFDRVAAVTGQPVEWVAAPGSVP